MNWIFSPSKTSFLLKINHSLREKTLLFINQKFKKKFHHYSPWMCHLEKINELLPLFEIKDLILKDKKVLSQLSQYYSLKRDGINDVCPKPIDSENEKIYLDALNHVLSVPTLNVMFKSIINHIVPLGSKGSIQKQGAGSSNLLARGAIFLSTPKMEDLSCVQLAVNMAHELGHQSLMIYQTSDRIIKGDLSIPVFSYVRQENRPIIQSFHASFALIFMKEFLEKFDKNNLSFNELEFAEKELQRIKKDFKNSLKEFNEEQFTDFGVVLLKELVHYAKAS